MMCRGRGFIPLFEVPLPFLTDLPLSVFPNRKVFIASVIAGQIPTCLYSFFSFFHFLKYNSRVLVLFLYSSFYLSLAPNLLIDALL